MIAALSIQFLLSFGMFLLLVLVQVLVYPQFLNVPQSSLASYAIKHSQLITVVVGPLMVAELLSLLLCLRFDMLRSIPILAACICLGVIWFHTFAVEVPLHHQIQQYSNRDDVYALIQGNKVRTILWGVKTLILALFMVVVVSPYFVSREISIEYISRSFKKPNGVSTLVTGSSTRIEPIQVSGDLTMKNVREVISANTIHFMLISEGDNALRCVVRTPGMKFPDVITIVKKDSELHFRSHAMFGYSDLNVNRNRMEMLRKLF